MREFRRRLLVFLPMITFTLCLGEARTVAANPTTMIASPSEMTPSPIGLPPWSKLRQVVSQLRTEEGTLRLFRVSPKLGDAYSSERHFEDFIKTWRERILDIPETATSSPTSPVTWEILHGIERDSIYLTFHHEKPAMAITILKMMWEEGELTKIVFMRGFSQTPFNKQNLKTNQYAYEYLDYRQR